jgi:hypothetical protein
MSMNDPGDSWYQDEDAGGHPALDLAHSAWLNAQQMRNYLESGFPREPKRDDHIELLLRMQQVIEEVAAGISYVYRATANEHASGQLGAAVDGLLRVIDHLQAGRDPLYSGGGEVAASSVPAQLAAASFPDSRDQRGILAGTENSSDQSPYSAARSQSGESPGATSRRGRL